MLHILHVSVFNVTPAQSCNP